MSRREIERNIIIDEVEGILEGLNEVSSVQNNRILQMQEVSQVN